MGFRWSEVQILSARPDRKRPPGRPSGRAFHRPPDRCVQVVKSEHSQIYARQGNWDAIIWRSGAPRRTRCYSWYATVLRRPMSAKQLRRQLESSAVWRPPGVTCVGLITTSRPPCATGARQRPQCLAHADSIARPWRHPASYAGSYDVRQRAGDHGSPQRAGRRMAMTAGRRHTNRASTVPSAPRSGDWKMPGA
jgi:hypothetical protein